MPNIGALLKAEIARLSKREIRKEVAGVRRASATHRREIAALKREVIALQRKSALLEKRTNQTANKASAIPDRPVRFVAKGLRSLRRRLGFSAVQLARVLGVSEQSVYNWETKKATPRKEQLAAINAMRGMGKREAQSRLEGMQSVRARRGKKGRGK